LHGLAPVGGPDGDGKSDGNLPPGAVDDQPQRYLVGVVISFVEVESSSHVAVSFVCESLPLENEESNKRVSPPNGRQALYKRRYEYRRNTANIGEHTDMGKLL